MDIPNTCEPIMTIGIAARKAGVSESTLRLYEREGLLISSRTQTGRRLYSLNDLRAVEIIRALIQQHGLNFAGIRALFAQLPCWRIKNCSDEDRNMCERFQEGLTPCWRLGGKGCKAGEEECKTCPVYTYVEKIAFPAARDEIPK